MNSMSALLDVRNLKTVFTSGGGWWGKPRIRLQAVNDVSLTLEQGQTLGLVGESGCGKSTLAKTIMRLIPAVSGDIFIQGQNVLSLKGRALRKFRCHVQMVFQDPYASLNPRMRVWEIVGEPLWVQGLVNQRPVLKSKVQALLEQVGLPESALKKFPHEFSGGQRQRVGIARAIALNPRLVICDEPVSALDVSIQSQILNLLTDLQAQYHMGYLFISHDLRVIQHISHHVAVMYLGKLMETASSENLYREPLHPYTQMLLSAIPQPVMQQERKVYVRPKGDIPSPSHPPSGCVFHTRCPIAEARCRQIVPELREIRPGHRVACIKV